eukprot:TRINITY_DN14499_c0_g1_i1.p1 TRINITY_DN14499_c0_g1~~TRINITY_DN14499_c0_g1_i1.p1  ORF type:complete len:446 (-),score=80.64 TRINITY_DN14499_c0_g1_i1:149-1486(-)
MATRITRNQASTNLLAAENAGIIGKKSMVGGKRKAGEDIDTAKLTKRAALGEITNNTGNTLKKQVKKGLTNIVSKGKEGLKVRETKASLLRQSFKKKKSDTKEETKEKNLEEVKDEIEFKDDKATESSSSSEEILLCELSESPDTSISSASSENVTKEENYIIVSPPRKEPPSGVIDFDLETKGDPAQHAEYALETFQYYKNREKMFRVPSYITAQNEITETMRSILVDWLVEVQESFELNHETLYTAVKLTDLYLSKKQVRKEDLQLVGATACLIASKIDERIPPMVDDFMYVCDDAYNRDQIMRMERKMLSVVGFDLGFPLSYRFLRRYGRVCKVTMPVLTLARYILESSLLHYSLNVELSESKLAAATLILAFKIKQIEGCEATLEYYSGHVTKELIPITKELHAMLQKPQKENLKTVRSKYSHKVFHEVAVIPVPETLEFS